jgi:hypothetical protein
MAMGGLNISEPVSNAQESSRKQRRSNEDIIRRMSINPQKQRN